MIVDIAVKAIEEAKIKSEAVANDLRYGRKQRYRLDLRMLDDEERERLLRYAKLQKCHGYKQLDEALATMALMKSDPTGQPIRKMRDLQAALVEHFLQNAPRKWVFRVEWGQRFPYYVDNIKYYPTKRADRSVRYEHVVMELRCVGNSTTSVYFELEDLKDQPNVIKAMARKNMKTENDALCSAYFECMDRYNIIVNSVGELYAATGTGLAQGDVWYARDLEVAMEREGNPAKVVIDDASELDEDTRSSRRRRGKDGSTIVDAMWWRAAADPKIAGLTKDSKGNFQITPSDDDDDDDEGQDNFKIRKDGTEVPTEALPRHPWVPVFDLARHQFVEIHSNELEPWAFDKTLGEKLVLPPKQLQVLNALVTGSANIMEDIVKGKTGGTIVICTGDPGTGKTLSAEVFAEIMEKPLYTVQCSQLGLSPDDLEKKLGVVLARANRWKCILLIDEADVYIRERGDDIMQNAIVGTWLRVLEYFRGVLFMTSNKGEVIDDAIMNRATAWIAYERPNKALLAKIWSVLAEQYNIPVDDGNITKLVDKWPHATGRNVKNLIKLAKHLNASIADSNVMDMFDLAGEHLDIRRAKAKLKPSSEHDGR